MQKYILKSLYVKNRRSYSVSTRVQVNGCDRSDKGSDSTVVVLLLILVIIKLTMVMEVHILKMVLQDTTKKESITLEILLNLHRIFSLLFHRPPIGGICLFLSGYGGLLEFV